MLKNIFDILKIHIKINFTRFFFPFLCMATRKFLSDTRGSHDISIEKRRAGAYCPASRTALPRTSWAFPGRLINALFCETGTIKIPVPLCLCISTWMDVSRFLE